MLIISRQVIAVFIIIFSIYGLITDRSELLPFLQLLFGLVMLIYCIESFIIDRKRFWGILFLGCSVISFATFFNSSVFH